LIRALTYHANESMPRTVHHAILRGGSGGRWVRGIVEAVVRIHGCSLFLASPFFGPMISDLCVLVGVGSLLEDLGGPGRPFQAMLGRQGVSRARGALTTAQATRPAIFGTKAVALDPKKSGEYLGRRRGQPAFGAVQCESMSTAVLQKYVSPEGAAPVRTDWT
jgi:hypothetical protein